MPETSNPTGSDTDPTIDLLLLWMKRQGLPVTRQNYIDLAYGKDVPEWTAELEAELPEELQDWSQFEPDRSQSVVGKTDT